MITIRTAGQKKSVSTTTALRRVMYELLFIVAVSDERGEESINKSFLSFPVKVEEYCKTMCCRFPPHPCMATNQKSRRDYDNSNDDDLQIVLGRTFYLASAIIFISIYPGQGNEHNYFSANNCSASQLVRVRRCLLRSVYVPPPCSPLSLISSKVVSVNLKKK